MFDLSGLKTSEYIYSFLQIQKISFWGWVFHLITLKRFIDVKTLTIVNVAENGRFVMMGFLEPIAMCLLPWR